MYRKCFFKNKGVLSRKFAASGLAAVFSAGMFGSYAGAMDPEQNIEVLFSMEDRQKLAHVLNANSIEDNDENAKRVFKFLNSFSGLGQNLMYGIWRYTFKDYEGLLKDEDFLIRICAYVFLFKFREFKEENNFSSINDFLEKWNYDTLKKYSDDAYVRLSVDDVNVKKLLDKIKNGWGVKLLKEVKEEVKKENEQNNLENINTNLNNEGNNENEKELLEKFKNEKHEPDNSKIVNTNFLNESINKNEKEVSEEENEQNNLEDISLHSKSINKNEKEVSEEFKEENEQNKSTNEYKLDEDKTKNKSRNTIFVFSVFVFIIPLVIFFAIKPAGKSKTNTGVPNNNNNNNNKKDEKINPSIEPEKDKDDEKVNPSIEPEKDKDDEKMNPSIEPEKDKDDEKMYPSTDPESDEQNSQQNNQEERPSVVLSNILKAAGATVTAGTLAYLFNKVSKSGKPSEVKNLRNVDDKYMYLDSDVNEVTKTEESEKTHDNYDTDGESADNSGTKQLLEDKNAEKIEEEQEKILESSALSDDTEATSDEDKNKD